MMLHIKALSSTWFQTKYFNIFPIYTYVIHVTPCMGPQGYNLNKLGRGPLDDATYQILRLYALWFKTRRFPYISL